MSNRPNIPAELKRKILVEAGHRCAIPTCRSMVKVEIHHIIPWCECQEHKEDNLIALCPNCHTLAHDDKIDKACLKMYKAKLKELSDVYTPFEIDILFECDKKDGVPFSKYLNILLKRLIDSNLIYIEDTGVYQYAGGVDMSPCWIRLTEEGKVFVEDLKSNNPR